MSDVAEARRRLAHMTTEVDLALALIDSDESLDRILQLTRLDMAELGMADGEIAEVLTAFAVLAKHKLQEQREGTH